MIFNLDGRRDYHLYKYSSRLFLLYMPLPVSRSFQDTFLLVRENQAHWQKTKSTYASVPIHLHVMFMHIVAMFLSLIYQYLYINGISVSLLCNNSLLFMTYTLLHIFHCMHNKLIWNQQYIDDVFCLSIACIHFVRGTMSCKIY